MEKDFLLYIIYIAFIEIRIHAYENTNEASIKLCNLLHTIPLILIEKENGKEAYKMFLEKVERMEMNSWLDNRKTEFFERYPMYKEEI